MKNYLPYVIIRLYLIIFPAICMAQEGKKAYPSIPAIINFEVDQNRQIDNKAAKVSFITSDSLKKKFLALDLINIDYGQLVLDLKFKGFESESRKFPKELFLEADLYSLQEDSRKNLVRKRNITIKEDEWILENIFGNRKEKTISWRWPKATERAQLVPGKYKMFLNLKIDDKDYNQFFDEPDKLFDDKTKRLQHLLIGTISLIPTMYGLLEMRNAHQKYENEYIVQTDGKIAAPIFNEAMSTVTKRASSYMGWNKYTSRKCSLVIFSCKQS